MSIKQVFDTASTEIINEIRANLIASGAQATGKTGRSLEAETDNEGMKVLGAKSFLFVEKGRKPGKKPPYKPILEWVQARGLGGQNPQGFAWGLVHAIANRGTISLRTDGNASSPRDIYETVVTKLRIESITGKITQFKVAQAKSEIVEKFRGQGVNIV